MPRGGHNAKPTALKVLEGNLRKDRLKNEPKPRPIAPKCPSWLDKEAKKIWRQLAPKLEKQGLLTENDGPLFSAYCEAYSRWKRTTEALRGMDPADPAYRKVAITAEKALHEMRLIGQEFGLSPASRSRLDLPETEPDDFEQFLNWKLFGDRL